MQAQNSTFLISRNGLVNLTPADHIRCKVEPLETIDDDENVTFNSGALNSCHDRGHEQQYQNLRSNTISTAVLRIACD